MIIWANNQPAPTLALDTTTGTTSNPTIKATATMTLALPKEALRAPTATAHVAELYLADIGVPSNLYAGDGLRLEVGNIFAEDEILRLW